MAEEQNNGQVAEVQKSYDDMSLEELEAEFTRTGGVVSDEPSNEPDEVLPDQPDEAQPVPEEAISPDEEAPPHTPAPESESPPEPDLPDERELELQEMRLQMERMRLDRQHFEHLAGRHATALDDLRKQIQTPSVRTSSPATEEYQDAGDYQYAETTSRPVPAPDNELAGKVAELQESQRAQETERAYYSFLDSIKSDLSRQGVSEDRLDSEIESVMEQITPSLKQRFEPYGDLSSYPAKTLSKVTRMVLDSAYTDVKLARVAELRKSASERRASQIAESRIVKQAASPSGSGGRPVKEPPPKSPSEMTAEEADAALIAEFGDGRANLRGRRR